MSNDDNKQQKNYKVTIYTDGACSGNPGKGGWGAILICKTKNKNGEDVIHRKDLSGGEKLTTNNRMELTAIIEAINIVKKKSEIELFTDSKYALDGLTKWIQNWQKNGWKSANKKPIKNIDLWKKLYELTSEHTINWHWVKGHADDKLNNEADRLAVAETKK